MREPSEVVSGPSRKMSMPVEQKSESDKEMSELRREVIEARNLVIKTDNLLKNLHAEVKSVGKRQEEFQKRQWISSAVAYALFAILCTAGAIMISSARTSTANQERERLQSETKTLAAQLEQQKADAAAQSGAQRSAAEVYKKMTDANGDDRLKGVDLLVKLDTSRLSYLERKALDDRSQLLRNEIGQAAFERGKAAFRKNDMATTVTELSRFVALNPQSQDLLDASYFLGTALNMLKKHEQAIPHLARFVNDDKKSKTRDYAMLLLAQSYEQAGQLDKALETARDALATYPNTQFASQLRGRISSAKRLQGAGADSAEVQAATATQPAVTVGSPAPAGSPVVPAAVKPAAAPAAAAPKAN